MGNKIKLGVILGGKSDEHDVSIMSAKSILKFVDKEKYEVFGIGISRSGKWLYFEDNHEAINNNLIDDLDFEEKLKESNGTTTKEAISMLINELDVVFPVLHGPFGEDGTIQGLFEMLDVPYVGANLSSSVLCMDKVISKQLLKDAGISVVECVDIMKMNYDLDPNYYYKEILDKFNYPLFVKPANLGSSVGISKVKNADELKIGIETAFKFDNKILVEEGIDCREVECAVLGNDNPKASVVGEILPSHEFYDYEAKYLDDGNSKMIIPADLSKETVDIIRETSIKAYKVLGITGLSRIDFFIDKVSGALYLNEINTMPGFTKYSMYPLLWQESGLSFTNLINELIELAYNKKNVCS